MLAEAAWSTGLPAAVSSAGLLENNVTRESSKVLVSPAGPAPHWVVSQRKVCGPSASH